jgi:hypothetical protein
MFHNETIRYSPYRIRECTDADKRFPEQVQRTELGYVIVRLAQNLEAAPLGRSPIKTEENKPNEKPTGTN